MISIITAIYNQLPINKVFVESLERYSTLPYELIILDNGSTDGSPAFFESKGARVIRNPANYSYPYTQNQGIRAAQYDYFAFLNNDIVVAPGWDKGLLAAMGQHQLDLVCPAAIERAESARVTRRFRRQWKWIKGMTKWLGVGENALRFRHRLMYGNWERFCAQRQQRFGTDVLEGFSGHSIVCSRKAIDLLGLWDERIQAADFDLYLRSKKRSLEQGDIQPIHIVLGVFHHHFERLTLKARPPAFADSANLIRLEEKWSKEEMDYLLADVRAFKGSRS